MTDSLIPSSRPSLVAAPLHAVHEQTVRPIGGVRKCRSSVLAPVQAHDLFRISRVSLGLSQDRAAELFGVTRRTVMSWENGKTRLPADALVWIESLVAKRTGT